MRTFFKVVGPLVLVGAVATAARAGYKHPTNSVIVGPAIVQGSLGSIRNTSNSSERLYCEVDAYAGQVGPSSVFCYAKSSNGTVLSCSTSDPVLIQAAQHINGDSWVYFTVSNGTCQSMIVQNGSLYAPKVL